MINIAKTLGKRPKIPKKSTFEICSLCNGQGKIYDPEDRDVIEGYKLATKKRCTLCDGSGNPTKGVINNLYQTTKLFTLLAQEDYDRRKQCLKSIDTKLTDEEIKVLTTCKLVLK